MLEDHWLLFRLKRGNPDALRQIYEKYKDELLALSLSLSQDKATAEDVLHDVMISFTEHAPELQLRTNLKSYLSSCIVNRIRNVHRAKPRAMVQLSHAETLSSDVHRPDRLAVRAELSRDINKALNQVPYEQKEVIILHLQSGMKFKTIADVQGVSMNTVQSRYRYGLDKLRTLLNGTVQK